MQGMLGETDPLRNSARKYHCKDRAQIEETKQKIQSQNFLSLRTKVEKLCSICDQICKNGSHLWTYFATFSAAEHSNQHISAFTVLCWQRTLLREKTCYEISVKFEGYSMKKEGS